jgi:hypothetical protein
MVINWSRFRQNEPNDGDRSYQFAARPSRLPNPGERDAYAMATRALPLTPRPPSRWRVRGAADGGSKTVGGNATMGTQDTKATADGIVTGANYRVPPDTPSVPLGEPRAVPFCRTRRPHLSSPLPLEAARRATISGRHTPDSPTKPRGASLRHDRIESM